MKLIKYRKINQAVQNELKSGNYDKVLIYAYGDRKFFDNGVASYTHGEVEAGKNGVFSVELYEPKSEISAEREKEIYLDWFRTRDEIESGDQAEAEREAALRTVKKYKLSKKEFEEIYRKVQTYVGWGVVRADILESR